MQQFQNDLGRLILTLSKTIIYNRNNHLADLGLTAGQADCIQYLLTNEGATINDLKSALRVTHQTAQGLVSRLEEKGLVQLTVSSADRRCKKIVVTEAGQAVEKRIETNRKRTASLLLKGMTKDDAATFARLLKRAYENVQFDGEEGSGV